MSEVTAESLRVMILGMEAIFVVALAFWALILLLRKAFPVGK